MTNGIVIVGGGLAAARVATAHSGTPAARVRDDPLGRHATRPYNRPPLSKGFLRGEIEADAVFVEPVRPRTPSSMSICDSAAR